MFHAVKSKNPAPFGTGAMLAEEEHEQKDDELDQLLEAQLQFERKLDHGNYPRGAVSQRCSTAQ